MTATTYTRSYPIILTHSGSAATGEGGDGLTLDGYAAVFDSPASIEDWDGTYTETIARGAFARSIAAKGPGGARLQFDHGRHPLIGGPPIGTIEMLREDTCGLHVRARMLDTWLVEPVRSAIAAGAITGMSFRFQVVSESWDRSQTSPLRTLHDVDLFELGPVVWPAYEATRPLSGTGAGSTRRGGVETCCVCSQRDNSW